MRILLVLAMCVIEMGVVGTAGTAAYAGGPCQVRQNCP